MDLDTVIKTWFNIHITFCMILTIWSKVTVLSNEITLQQHLSQNELMKSKSFWRKQKK
ncbi:hypothetical protein U9K47_04225 [Bacillus toyonensis]|uniref:hypothetical protein n=1 Tax=Bacillus toyonensis TaxID=155322 RepID=UPI0034667103